MLKRKRLTAGALLCTGILVLSLAACGAKSGEKMQSETMTEGTEMKTENQDTSTDNMDKIRVGYMPYYSSVPLQVIKDEKLDEKYGFTMKTVSFPSGGPMAEALGAGEWDIGPIGAGGMVAVPTYDAKLIEDVESQMDGIWVFARPDSDIVKAGKTLKDYPDIIGSKDSLKGKTMIGTVGNVSQYTGLNYLSLFGLKQSDVNFVNMETANIYTAFVAGNGDLACIGSPSAGQQLIKDGYIVVGGLSQQKIPQQDAMLISDSFYKNNKNAAVKFMTAWLEAAEKLNSNADYEIEMTKKFYTENGRTDFTDEAVKNECGWNTYVDKTNYKDRQLGQWMTDLVTFMADNGTMDKSAVAAMKTNIKDDILQEAVDNLNKAK